MDDIDFVSLAITILAGVFVLFFEHFIVIPAREKYIQRLRRQNRHQRTTQVKKTEDTEGNKRIHHELPKPTLSGFLSDPVTSSTLLVTLSISLFVALDALFPKLVSYLFYLGFTLPQGDFISNRAFILSFAQSFTFVYAIVAIAVLMKVYEQIELIDRVVEQEAIAVQLLYQKIKLLIVSKAMKSKVLASLLEYIDHVVMNYRNESDQFDIRETGNLIFGKLSMSILALKTEQLQKGSSFAISDIWHQLNAVTAARQERIRLINQQVFRSLRFLLLPVTLIWIIPYYFASERNDILGNILVFSITFVAIFILSISEDLSEPFYGVWRVNNASLQYLKQEVESYFKR
jgi:hypothetical protein